jgi:DNA polymerase I-like protein with 3'-5' exonuclease and polymerase domains
MNCDPSYSALPALAALGAAIGSSHVASPKKGWREPPYVWALPIGKSGAIKSPPYRDVEDLAEDINDRLEAEYEAEVAGYDEKFQAWTEAKKAGGDPGPRPKPPVPRAFIKGDVTVEALVGDLQDNPRGLLIGQDELTAWIGGFVKYSGKTGSSDLSRWLQLHSAGSINYTRKTGDRRKVRIRGVGVSVAGTIQPKILSRVLNEEFRASGFLARLLLAMPSWRKRQWTEAEVDDSIRGAFADLLKDLHALPRGSWPDGRPCPHLVRLTDDAKAKFVEFYQANGEAIETADEDMSAAMSKLEGYALRFALIFHCCRLKVYAKDARITAADMEAAIGLTVWFRDEAERVYLALAEPADVQGARHLAEVVRKLAERYGGRVTARRLQRSNCRRYRTSATAEAALETLVGLGFGRWVDVPSGPRGGPPTRAYVPGMTYDATGTTDDEEPDDTDGGGEMHDTTTDDGSPPGSGSPGSDGGTGAATGDCEAPGVPDAVAVSVASGVMQGGDCDERQAQPPSSRSEACVERDGVVSCTSFVQVTAEGELAPAIEAVRSSRRVGLDIETTGLSHVRDRARLLSLATPAGTFLVDLFRVDPTPLWPVLAAVEVVGHNLGFDVPFLMRLGFTPGAVADTMLASQVLHAGDRAVRHGLKDVAQRVLGLTVDKELQQADWSGPLSPAMLRYAALDAEIPLPLWDGLSAEATAAGLGRVLDVEMNALPCVAWAAFHGVGFDRLGWERLASDAAARRGDLLKQLNTLAPKPKVLFGNWKWDSPRQVKAALAVLGVDLDSTDDAALATVAHPVGALLREYRAATKLVSSYGQKWLDHVSPDGRVYADWRQLGAEASGRMSCRGPNLQQLPHGPGYRDCLVAPGGRVLVRADFSQIELRAVARITDEKRMVGAFRAGEDLHALTARAVTGKAEVTKADRQLAKCLNFGLLYGMGARGLADYARANYGLSLTPAQAAVHRARFFQTYPGLRGWHRSVGDGSVETSTLTGRRRLAVTKFTEKLNTPVQGTNGTYFLLMPLAISRFSSARGLLNHPQ